MRLTLLACRPGTLWIGPDVVLLFACTMYEVGAVWGWDRHDPFVWLPRLACTRYEIGAVYVASWLGFTLSFTRIDVTGIEEQARRVLAKNKLVEWQA